MWVNKISLFEVQADFESNYHRQRRWLVLFVLEGTLLLIDYLNKLSCFSSISFSFFSCHFTYSRICFSFKPTVLTQYPRHHKCRPQYFFPKLSYRWNSFRASLPFKYPITEDTEYFGGIHVTIWTWSGFTFNSSTSIRSFCLQSECISRSVYRPISSLKILNLYFGQNTIWYLHSYNVCDSFLKRFDMMYLLVCWYLPGGGTSYIYS